MKNLVSIHSVIYFQFLDENFHCTPTDQMLSLPVLLSKPGRTCIAVLDSKLKETTLSLARLFQLNKHLRFCGGREGTKEMDTRDKQATIININHSCQIDLLVNYSFFYDVHPVLYLAVLHF